MNTGNKRKKTIEDEAQIFISTRFFSNDKNLKVSDRDNSPFSLQKKDKKDGVTTCRKPIILKGNLPSVFDIDKLKIIKRNERRNVGSFYDKHRILLKTEVTSNQINELFTNPTNITQDYFDNKETRFYSNEGLRKERSCESRKFSNKLKSKISPFQSKFLDIKKTKEKNNSTQNINYFNNTNDRILLSKNSEKFKCSLIEKSFSKSILHNNNPNHSTSHKNNSILLESVNEKDPENKKKNNKASKIHKAEIEVSLAKEAIQRRPSQIKIKNFKKYNLDPKAIKRIFTKTPPSLTELGLIKSSNNFDKQIKLEDVITLSIIKSDSKSRLKKVFSVVNFEVLLVKEILMNSKINVISAKENISQWKTKMKQSDHFVKIYQEYINQPENYFSILMEYLEGFSLQDLINNVGCLNEDLLKPILLKIIDTLIDYTEKFNSEYKDICPCDILFDKKGNLKIIPFIIKAPFRLDSDTQNRNEVKCKCYDYFHNKNFLAINTSNTHSTNDSQSQCANSANNFLKKSEDSRFPHLNFNLGLLILICLLGGNKVLTIKALNTTNLIELHKSKICCLYHYLISYDETNCKDHRFKFTTFINEKLISNDLSNLLCELLTIDIKQKELKKIRSHRWFKSSRTSKTRIQIKELIKITRDFKRPNILLKNETPLNNFINSLGIILLNNKDIKNNNSFVGKLFEPIENVKSLVDQKRHYIKEISKEIGANVSMLTEKMVNLIMEIKTDKFFQK